MKKPYSKLRSVLIVTFAVALGSFSTFAQPCPITWGTTVQISNTAADAFVPKLAVVGDTVHVVYSAAGGFYRRSTYRGKTWDSEVLVIPAESLGVGPVPLAASGACAYVVWGNMNSSGETRSIKIRRTIDAGATWLEPQVLFRNPSGQDYLVAPRVAAFDSLVYVVMVRTTGTQQWFLTRSSDFGTTWDPVRQITFNSYGTAFGAAGGIRAVGSNVHFTFERSIPPSGREIVYTRSTDRGQTWDSLTILSTVDSFQAWEPNVAADDSGNVYVSWQDAKYGSIGGFAGTVLLRRSTDNGQTWMPEQRVSMLASSERSSLAVSGDILLAAWEDDRFGGLNPRVYYVMSPDQGATWCNEMMLGDSSLYSQNVAVETQNRAAFATWSVIVPGNSAQIFFRRGDMTTGVTESGEALPASFRVFQPYPNPFNASTSLEYMIPHAGNVGISVFNVLGQYVCSLADSWETAGRYRRDFDASRLASGMYYVVFQFDHKITVRGVMVMK